MADKLFTTEEQKEYEELARKRGFESLRDYLKVLIERDIHKQLTSDEMDDAIRQIIQDYEESHKP